MTRESKVSRLVVVISGSGSNLQAIIDACQDGRISASISAVISNKPDVYGLERAKKAGITSTVLNHKEYESRESYDMALAELIDSFEPDLIVLAGFMRILSAEFVKRYPGKMLNIHPSLLPKYPGLHTHQRALQNNETEHGATVHFVTEELDGGPILLQGIIDVSSDDDESSLASRVQQEVEHTIYPLAIEYCVGGRAVMSGANVSLDGALLPPQGKTLKLP